MKTTILIKEKRTQLVLEPESDHDKAVIKILNTLPNTYLANFFDCLGGYTYGSMGGSDLIIVFDEE